MIEARVLAKNDALADQNRAYFEGREILALNVMGAPGSGKTTLLEALIPALGVPVSVIEGDQAGHLDAERIARLGVPVVQVSTGTGCHLDAAQIRAAVRDLKPPFRSVLFLENVGNLVCPALFDLGERARVVVWSVTEGADKPLKYPHMFRRANLVVLSKADLLPHVDFDPEAAVAALRAVLPDATLAGSEPGSDSAARGTPVLRSCARKGACDEASIAGIAAWIRAQAAIGRI